MRGAGARSLRRCPFAPTRDCVAPYCCRRHGAALRWRLRHFAPDQIAVLSQPFDTIRKRLHGTHLYYRRFSYYYDAFNAHIRARAAATLAEEPGCLTFDVTQPLTED